MSLRAVVLAVLFSSIVSGCGGSAPPPSQPSELLGKPVTLSLPSDDGNLVTVPPAGGAVVLDFWGPTCVPCQKELPSLVARKADLEAQGARLVLVAVLGGGETTDGARQTLESWGVRGERFLVDNGGASRSQAGVAHLPATLVIDRGGMLRWVKPLGASVDDVVAAVVSVR